MGRFAQSCLIFGLMAAASATAVPPGPPEGWAFERSDLVPDPAVKFGQLPNGLRYAIRRNALPAGHVSFRLGVRVGFAHETKEERGLAHFVEHMAFNGTTHFPGETLTTELEKRGIELGPELSAFTFLTHTIYNLDAPAAAPEDLHRGFTVLRDFADGLQFDPAQIKRERGVITSEMRDRQSPMQRADLARRIFLYGGTALANPFSSEVDGATRKSLRAFYDKWYRPERMVLVVVGEADPAVLETMLHEHFDSLRARTTPAPVFDPGGVFNPAADTTALYSDRKINGLTVELDSLHAPETGDTRATRRRWTARNLVLYLLNARLRERVRSHPSQLLDFSARSVYDTPYSLETCISVSTPTADWRAGLTELEHELRRSLEYRFTPTEIAEARAATLTDLERRVKMSATDHSPGLAGELLQQALWDVVPTSPEDDLRRARDWLPQITAEEMTAAWSALWPAQGRRAFVFGYFPFRNAEALIATALHESAREKIEAPAKVETLPFAYTDFGPPGTIKHQEYLPALDLHLVEFANGVRVNLKHTAFEAATVELNVRLGHGMQSEPAQQPGLGALAGNALINGGLGRHPPEELRRIFADAGLSLGFECDEDCFTFLGQASSGATERLLQLLAAYLTDPAWDQPAVAVATTQLSSYYHDLNFTPEGAIALSGFRVLSNGDPRYSSPTAANVQARTRDELKHWLDPVLRSAPLELGLVGDFDPEQIIPVLARTVGSLPARTDDHPAPEPPKFVKSGLVREFHYQGENNRVGIEVAWPLWRCNEVRISRQTEVLCAILSDRVRLKVREELGATYSPSVTFWKSDASESDGYLIAYITVKPNQAKKLTKLLVDLADTLGRKGATEQEFTLAREPILDRSVTDQNENSYWVHHIIACAQSKPAVRQWPLTRVSDLRQMSLAEVNTVAREVLPAPHAIIFSAAPGRVGP